MRTSRAGSMPVGCFWIGVVLFAIMAPLSWGLLRDAVEEWSISRLEPVPCTIVNARLDVIETSRSVRQSSRRDTSVTHFVYVPRISYRIVAGGATTEGSRFASSNYLEDLDAETAKRYMQAFVPGAKVTCYHDPRQPSKSVLVRAHGDRRRYLLLLPGLGIALLSGLTIGVTLHDRGWRPVFGPVATFATQRWQRASSRQRLAIVLVALFLFAMLALSIYNTI